MYSTFLVWQATKTTRLLVDPLYRPVCDEKTLHYFRNYSYPACQVECLIGSLLKECDCIGINTFGNLPKDKICSPSAAFNCFYKLAFKFSTMLTRCRVKNCSEACISWSYKVSLSSGKVFNPVNQEEMMTHWRLPKGDPKVSLIIGDVYFSDIEYLDIQEVPAMTLENFISNIGGAMGLWTGASIVTWIHLVYFCIRTGFLRSKKTNGETVSPEGNGNVKKYGLLRPMVIHDHSVANGESWRSHSAEGMWHSPGFPNHGGGGTLSLRIKSTPKNRKGHTA